MPEDVERQIEELRKLLSRCADNSERSEKLREEANLLVMKARIMNARLKADKKRRQSGRRAGS
jgi:hypothetical protein